MSSCRNACYLFLFIVRTAFCGIQPQNAEDYKQYQGYGNIKSRPIVNMTDAVYKSALRFLRCAAVPNNTLDVALLDPLTFDFDRLVNRQTIRLTGTINGTVNHLSNVVINQTTIILPSAYATFKGNVQHMSISGWYNVSGTLSKVIPVFGSGLYSIDMYNVSITLNTQLGTYQNNSLYMTDFNVNFYPKSIQIALGEFLGGGPLGSLMQDFLQDGVSNVLSRVRPQIQNSIKQKVISSSNHRILQFPRYRDFLIFLLKFGNGTTC